MTAGVEARPIGDPPALADDSAVPTPRRPRRSAGNRLLRWLVRATSLALAVLLWWLLTENDVRLWLRFDQIPGPVEVYEAFRHQLSTPLYYQDLAQSLVRILTGFALASVAGVGLGILLARSRWLADFFQPVLEVVRPIPAIALVPVAILLFPTNEQGIVFITSTAAFFPILVSTRHAVRALPTVPDAQLVIVGDGPQRADLEELVAATGTTERVTFLGQCPRDQVMTELARAAVVAIPSQVGAGGDQDGTPVVLGEAIAAGVPVVVSALGGLAEHVVDGFSGRVVTPGSVDELAAALREVFADPAGAERLAAGALDGFNGSLDLASVADRYRKILDEAAGR